jgi:hypothetical protein
MGRAITTFSVFAAALITLLTFNPAQAKIKKIQSTAPTLSESERDSLRYRLENAWNEVDLIVRNSNTDKRDVQRQEKEFKSLQVYTKFPLATTEALRPASVHATLKKSLDRFGLKLGDSKLLDASKPDHPIPTVMPRNAQEFKFTEDQLIQKVRLDLTLKGTKRQLQDWMNSWNTILEPEKPGEAPETSPTPYLEWDPNALTTLPEMVSETTWKVHVQAFYFRDIRYPKLQPQDPLQILPAWAKKSPELFKSQEPLLWGLVEKTQATIPQALPLYETKARFALNAARMSFFTSKVTRFE